MAVDARRYVDTRALEAYEDHDGQETVVSRVVMGSPSEVFDAWLRDVWVAGGNQVHEGVGRGHTGYVRRVPLGVEEEILSAGLPQDSDTAMGSESEGPDAQVKIPSICYRVCKFGPFPLKSHLALVRFVDATAISESAPESHGSTGTPMTLVVWTVKTEASDLCNRLHCGGLVRLVFRTALQTFLRSLAKSAAATKQMSAQ